MLLHWVTTTKHVFVPGHLSRQALGPGQYVAFVPGPMASRSSGGTGAFCPGWCLQRGQNSLAPLFPSFSPCPSHSAHLFLLFLARERGVLAHFFTTFVKIFDSPVHPSALKVWGLFFSSSIACVAHFMF